MKKLEWVIIIALAGGLIFFDYYSDKDLHKKLRTRHLTESVEGIITGVHNSKYSTTTKVYGYTYKVNGETIGAIYKMEPVLEGIKKDAPVKVIYLKEHPRRSRLVWIKEDLDWIE